MMVLSQNSECREKEVVMTYIKRIILLLWRGVFFVSLGVSVVASAGEKPGYPFPQHIDQHTITQHPFDEIYEWGNKLFHAEFNSLDGVGANLSSSPPGTVSAPQTPTYSAHHFAG
jgi:hypothetical protein